MDALTAVVCLALGSALPVSVVLFALRRGWRQLAVAEAYHDVARRLGLPADTRGVSLQGHLGVQRLWVGEVMVGHGPERRMVVWAVLDHDRPLGLGLEIRRRGRLQVRPPHALRRAWARLTGGEVVSEEEELLRQLELRSDDPGVAHQIVTQEGVRAHLGRVLRRWRRVVVNDDHVQVHLREPLATAEALQSLVDDLRALSSALVEAREELGPPTALSGTAGDWQAIADHHGLEVEAAYPAAGGAVDGRRVRVWPASTGLGYCAELRVVFRPHRPLGLKIAPQVGPDGYWSVGQDIQCGDNGFDSTFVIKGWDPEAVRDLLHAEAREHLLALHAHGQLDVDDVRLRVRDLRLDPAKLDELVGRAIATASALGW